RNKGWLLLATLLVSALLVTACPAAAPVAETGAQPAADGAEASDAGMSDEAVTISIWHGWAGEYYANIEQVFQEYMDAHPNVTIELSKPDNLGEAAKVAIPAGEGPDIFAWANDSIGDQALSGNIVPLNDLGIDQEFLENTYEPAAVNGVVWQGQIWGLPESQEGIALVYNKALVSEDQLPSDPMDFADLLAKATQYKEANGIPLFCNQGFPGGDAYHVAPVYFGFGVPSYVDDEGNVHIDTPEGVAAAQWLSEVKGVLDTEASHDICKAAITEGQVGAWWTGPWAIADLEAANIDYGIIPMGRPFVGIKTLMLTANAADRGHAEVALDVMKYFTSAEVQAKLAVANKTIPAATAALQDPEVQGLATISGFGASLNLGIPMANTPYASAQWGPIGDATAAIWNGAQTPEEAVAAAQVAIEDAIAQMK
ncbi:MAG: extracellular solute-binding protein, partial [Caldilineaceae bacterium]|nr:extracellular solute-binding protein [Caldilineaceae bacterium]